MVMTSCATTPPRPYYPAQSRSRVIHTVAPGETFWRISKMYDVPITTILRANNLRRSNSLQMGQEIVIPGATRPKPVISLIPSKKWKYIIIHHSATDEGSSLAFHKNHLDRGWDKGVGYHFVIDNDSSGKFDGQIETTPRWLKQQDGAHCKASDMNLKSIGICLVGNFEKERVSKAQMDSLVYLINELRYYYRIPRKRILMHQDVRDAATNCPGSNFPLYKFKRRLR